MYQQSRKGDLALSSHIRRESCERPKSPDAVVERILKSFAIQPPVEEKRALRVVARRDMEDLPTTAVDLERAGMARDVAELAIQRLADKRIVRADASRGFDAGPTRYRLSSL